MGSDPTSTRLYLVRHGRVDPTWRDRIYGDLDAPLSPEGEDQAREVARRLADRPLVAVVSSGLSRAEFGAAAIRTGRNLARRDDARLKELSRGTWGGLTLAEIEQRWPGAWDRWWRAPDRERPPEGESVSDLAARVLPALDELASAHAGDEAAVVAHSWVIRVAVVHALGVGPGAVTRFDLPPAGLVVVDWPTGANGDLARPVLGAFHTSALPDLSRRWFRGPRRT
jgi:broad specificity phosphatase PhoE